MQKGDGPVLWLYGTIHDAPIEAVPPEAIAELETAAVFASELGDAPIDPEDGKLARIERGPGLDQLLPANDWYDLRDTLRGTINEQDLRRAKPWYAVSLLTTHATKATPEMDRQLAERAHDHHVPVEALETARDQLVPLDTVVTIEDLKEAIHARKEIQCDTDRLRAAYDAGDEAAMTAALIVPKSAEPLVYARNRVWMPKLEGYLGAKGGFVAVGLAHLLGDQGLPAQLAAKGYTVGRASIQSRRR